MQKPVHPLVLAGIIAAAVVVLFLWGRHSLQPSHYTPSPGAGGRPERPMPAYEVEAARQRGFNVDSQGKPQTRR